MQLDDSIFGSDTNQTETKLQIGTAHIKEGPVTETNIIEHIKAGGSVALIPNGSKAIIVRQEFSPEVKNKINELEAKLLSVKAITSQDEAAKANAILKSAKQFEKALLEERKTMTSVLDEEKKSIMDHQEKIVNVISKLIATINANIVNFQKEELRKEQEREVELKKKRDEELRLAQIEADRKSGIQKKIIDFENSVIRACGDATIGDIDDKIKKLASTKILKEAYMEFLPEAEIMYQNCVTRMSKRKVELMELAELAKKNQEEADRLAKEQEEKNRLEALKHKEQGEEKMSAIKDKESEDKANAQMGYEFKVAVGGEKIKGVQKRWVFDATTIDMSLLPDEYKTFDEKKIKEAISAGAREIPGVNIFQDISNVSK
jgi:hypothetical protein